MPNKVCKMIKMKIAIVGSNSPFTTEYFYARAFESLGHKVAIVDQYSGLFVGRKRFLYRLILTRASGIRDIFESEFVNEIVVKQIRNEHPDIVIIFKGEALSKQSISQISSEFSTFLFYPDAYRYQSLLKGRINSFECVFTHSINHSLYYKLGARRVITIPWACDPGFHRKIKTRKLYDVVFMGSPYLNRYVYLRKLDSVHIFGSYWIIVPGIKHETVLGDNFIRIINQSKINLNIQHPTDSNADAPTWRIFEVAGCGGFILSSHIPSLNAYFPDIVTFKNPDDMVSKALWYIDNESERDEISQSLMERCRKYHTFVKRAEEMLSVFH